MSGSFGVARRAAARGTVVLAMGIAALPLLPAPVEAATTTVLTDCSEQSLRNAVAAGGVVQYGVSCSTTLSAGITVPAGTFVTVDAAGYRVTLTGAGATRHFVVDGGNLTLIKLSLIDGRVVGAPGVAGVRGGDGDDGRFGAMGAIGVCVPFVDPDGSGDPGVPGTDGAAGSPGSDGGAGGAVRGGSLLVNAGALTLDGVTISASTITGGKGGAGAFGGNGGAGGDGGYGGPGASSGVGCFGPGKGGDGGPGGSGGMGGDGGDGGVGGDAQGGAIYNAGTLTIRNGSTITGSAVAGTGGDPSRGGSGGAAGHGGTGGNGGDGAEREKGATGGAGGAGGHGGAGGTAGTGGRGGAAFGGAIYNTGTLVVQQSTLSGLARGGEPGSASSSLPGGGSGGAGGLGGDGGAGGYGQAGGSGGDGGPAGPGGSGGQGGGGSGGPGGGACYGGSIYNTGTVELSQVTFLNASAVAGDSRGFDFSQLAGRGGDAGLGGVGGTGAPGSTGDSNGGAGGGSGAGGDDGEFGQAGAGTFGSDGGAGRGGAIYNAGTLTAVGGSFGGNRAIGGPGGQGARSGYPGSVPWTGKDSGAGGKPGDGGPGRQRASNGDGFDGGPGGKAGSSGRGASGRPTPPAGTGGAGGPGEGGAVYDRGTATFDQTTFTTNRAEGGRGGGGGAHLSVYNTLGGTGGVGSDARGTLSAGGSRGGSGSSAYSDTDIGYLGGSGAFGGDGGSSSRPGQPSAGGRGGDGGPGGPAHGGAIYSEGDVAIVGGALRDNTAVGGVGGSGGSGGYGGDGAAGSAGYGGGGGSGGSGAGPGGAGGNGAPGGKPGTPGAGTPGAAGGRGGDGGVGGAAEGGATYASGSLSVTAATEFRGNVARGGEGGSAGAGGQGGQGGYGAAGGRGSNGGGYGNGSKGGPAGVPADGTAGTAASAPGATGPSGAGGSGAAGGVGRGGGLFNVGVSSYLHGLAFIANTAVGGVGGMGGDGRVGIIGAPGGSGGDGGNAGGTGANGGDGGNGSNGATGGSGGDAGDRGDGGAAAGGAIFTLAPLADGSNASRAANTAIGGAPAPVPACPGSWPITGCPGGGGDGGGGGLGGRGGIGWSYAGTEANGDDGATGTRGMKGAGGAAGLAGANGLALFADTNVDLSPSAAPTAVDDAYVVQRDRSLIPPWPGVLANDTSPDGKPLTAVLLTNPAHGTINSFSGTGGFTYVPQRDWVGIDSFTYKTNDGIRESGPATVTITVGDPPAFMSGPPTYSAAVGTPYSFTFTASGIPAPTLALAAGTLPAGLTLDASGLLSGTPSEGGVFHFKVSATNAVGSVTSDEFTISVRGTVPAMTSGPPPDAVLGESYSFTFTASGTPAPMFANIGFLPTGLKLDAMTGVLSGTSTEVGSWTFRVQVLNSAGSITAGPYIIVVTDGSAVAPSFVSGPPPSSATVGGAYSYTFTADGTPEPSFEIASGSLPPGLALETTGVLSGTPTAPGRYEFSVVAANAAGAAVSDVFSILVSNPGPVALTILTDQLPDATVGLGYDTTLQAAGGVAPYRWVIASGALPKGLKLDAKTGRIRGTPSAIGTSTVTVAVTDAAKPAAAAQTTLTLAVRASSIIVLPEVLPDAQVATSYKVQFLANGGSSPYKFSMQAALLPPGLTLKSGGQLTGKPTAAGPYTFTVRVVDKHGSDAVRTYTLDVRP